jgi:hypothetical protein
MMSDQYIIVIPESPDFVPDQTKQQQSISYFRSITPPDTKIEASVTNQIQFIDCGSNFESIECPDCGANIEIQTWQSWMGIDFYNGGFILNLHKVSCCHRDHTLQELRYHFPQGFARFQIKALNPDISQLTPDQLIEFTQVLGCPVRAIYRHY